MNDLSQPPPTPPPCGGYNPIIFITFNSPNRVACVAAIKLVQRYEKHRKPKFWCRNQKHELQIAFKPDKEPDEAILRQLRLELKDIDGIRTVTTMRE